MGKFEAAYAVFTNIHYQVQLKSQGKMQGAEETRLTHLKSMNYLLEASSFQIHNSTTIPPGQREWERIVLLNRENS